MKLTISLAISTSRMRLSAACVFSCSVAMLLIVCSRRFCTEPKVERDVDTCSIASSIFDRLTVPEKLKIAESTLNAEPEP